MIETQPPCRVKVGIPHFFSESGNQNYGSGRKGERSRRALALGRCLSALLDLRRHPHDCSLHIGARRIDVLEAPTGTMGYAKTIELTITVHSDGQHELTEVLEPFEGLIERKRHKLEDPRQLPLVTRDSLIHDQDPVADLTLYLEDDLVIADHLYIDKQLWFLNRTNHKMVLMPHRYEPIHQGGLGLLLVDGPLSKRFIGRFTTPQRDVAKGSFLGRETVSFDITDNPHSGSFALSRTQVAQLQTLKLPNEGFVGPMETAATLTALKFFHVAKPSLEHRNFLLIEHGHPSFLGYLNNLPIEKHSQVPLKDEKP